MTQTSSTNERQLRAQRKLEARDAEMDKTIIVTLMGTIQGRRWIWNQLAFAQVFVGSESLDPGVMAFEKGRRNTGLRLLDSVTRHAPAMFVKMLEENSNVKLTSEPEEEENEDEQN